MKPSFSLKWLFVGIAVVGVALSGLLNANKWWLSGVYSATVVVLVLSTILAGRDFARGFAIAGWTLFVLTLTPWAAIAEQWLPTTQFGMWAFAFGLVGEMSYGPIAFSDKYHFIANTGEDVVRGLRRLLMTQCFFVIGFGLLGGYVARYFAKNKKGTTDGEH